MYTVASPDPEANPWEGVNYLALRVQLYANEYKETLTPNPNEYNSTLRRGTSRGAAPTYTIYTGGGINYLTLRVQF